MSSGISFSTLCCKIKIILHDCRILQLRLSLYVTGIVKKFQNFKFSSSNDYQCEEVHVSVKLTFHTFNHFFTKTIFFLYLIDFSHSQGYHSCLHDKHFKFQKNNLNFAIRHSLSKSSVFLFFVKTFCLLISYLSKTFLRQCHYLLETGFNS